MRFRVIWAILALVLAVPSTVLGQTMKPFAKFSLSKESAVRAIQMGTDGDTSVLNIKASTLVETWNKAFDLRLEHREDLAEYIRSADVSACPTEMGLSRLRKDGTVDLRGWDRKAHRNEQCLVKDGRVLASLWCFNTTPNLYLAVESPEPTPSVDATPTTTNAQVGVTRPNPEPEAKPAKTQKQAEPEPKERSWWAKHWRWPVGTAILSTAIGIAGNELGWWDRRRITQCVAVDSPGFCSRYK